MAEARYTNYEKFKHPTADVKFYRPNVLIKFDLHPTKRVFKAATKAANYGRQLAARYTRRFAGCEG